MAKFAGAGPIMASLLLGAMPASADTVTCADAAMTIRVEYDITFDDSEARGKGVVTRVAGQFRDFDVSTVPSGDAGVTETISDQVSDYDRLEVDLEDPSIAKIVLRLRLFRDWRYDNTDADYDEHMVAGTLSVMSQGVWAVTCTGW
jgi:major membrane immunogen (membrane-anchored lipoprotein)